MADPTPAPRPAPKTAAPAGSTAPAPSLKGDMRAGVGFWSMGTMVAGIASDLAKPVADLALWLFIAFGLAASVCAWLTFFRKPPLQSARTLFGAMAIGAAVFGFFLAAPLLAGSTGKDRGIIATIVPPFAAVQTAVLPLSPVQKQLLTLSSDLSSGDPEARSAAARAAISDPKEDKALRRAKLERILRSSDPNIQQAGIVQALADRGRSPLLILPDQKAVDGPLKTFLTGAQFTLYSVNVATGGFYGILSSSGGNPRMDGTIANGRLILNSAYTRPSWKNGLVLDLRIDSAFRLIGTARTPEDQPIEIEVPLL